jgi:cell division protein FtsI (penicillin-binding protein 3)
MAQLQLLSGDKYEQLSTSQALHTIPVFAERGSIFDRHGRDLALSVRRSTVYADPALVLDPLTEAAKLAPVLHADQAFLVKQLSAKPSRFQYLAHTVPDDVAAQVRTMALPGIGMLPESARSYPAGSLAQVLLGTVGTEGHGLFGLESQYNSVLSGHPGKVVVEQDPQGHDIPNTEKTLVDAQRGADIVLTIDENLQWETEYALLDQVTATEAKAGMAAVIDVKTGQVLSMASVTGSNASGPARVALPDEHNAPLTDLFAPGSTTKLITLSWALEHHHITPESVFQVPYSIKVDPHVKPFFDAEWHPQERMTVADILRESSNVGTIQIAQTMTNEEIADGVRAFGLGKRTSVHWPGQPDGLLLDPAQYYATGKAATAIGYGAATTGMQMLDAFTTIANGGTTRPPYMVSATIDEKGRRNAVDVPKGQRVVTTATAKTMTAMMQGVVSSGTGTCAAIPGYPVAGKTGTSKKLAADGKYSDSATMASFIGFAPADHPRFAAIVVLDEPAFEFEFGGAAAAPVWSEIMRFALTEFGVPPTDITDAQYNAARAAAKYSSCTVPHGDDLTRALARLHEQRVVAAEKATKTAKSGASTTTSSLPSNPSPVNAR